ncbi:MAG: hypothetical protein DBY30_08440 [Verrucomicrobia bacterium]|nr:MAG: hypothetical protein DBY30_08440 [Verrucomicrobiota bacterium]
MDSQISFGFAAPVSCGRRWFFSPFESGGLVACCGIASLRPHRARLTAKTPVSPKIFPRLFAAEIHAAPAKVFGTFLRRGARNFSKSCSFAKFFAFGFVEIFLKKALLREYFYCFRANNLLL